jgi:hypothetical protein
MERLYTLKEAKKLLGALPGLFNVGIKAEKIRVVNSTR